MNQIQTTADDSPVVGAGAAPPFAAPAYPSTWCERHIARRNAARAFLGSKGMVPYRPTGSLALSWSVPGYTGQFDDHELVNLARYFGWEE